MPATARTPVPTSLAPAGTTKKLRSAKCFWYSKPCLYQAVYLFFSVQSNFSFVSTCGVELCFDFNLCLLPGCVEVYSLFNQNRGDVGAQCLTKRLSCFPFHDLIIIKLQKLVHLFLFSRCLPVPD
jgi:hypothetical protein